MISVQLVGMAVACGQAEQLYPVLYGATAAEQQEFLAAAVSLTPLASDASVGGRSRSQASHSSGSR